MKKSKTILDLKTNIDFLGFFSDKNVQQIVLHGGDRDHDNNDLPVVFIVWVLGNDFDDVNNGELKVYHSGDHNDEWLWLFLPLDYNDPIMMYVTM